MIETLPTRPATSDLAIGAETLAKFAAFQDELAGRSQIVWAEHCSECAYPKCYETCAFYTPRSDLHCRRFEAGIEPVRTGGGSLHRIRFRQWGKLEGRGNVAVAPLAQANARDRKDASIADALAAAPAPYVVKRKLAARWNVLKEAYAARTGALDADAFVVEALATDGLRHPLTLTLLNVGENGGRLFQTRFEAGPDYRRLTVPLREIEKHVDLTAHPGPDRADRRGRRARCGVRRLRLRAPQGAS